MSTKIGPTNCPVHDLEAPLAQQKSLRKGRNNGTHTHPLWATQGEPHVIGVAASGSTDSRLAEIGRIGHLFDFLKE